METKRLLLFLIGCIGTRSLFAYLAKIASPKTLSYLGYAALLPAIGFTYIYLTGSRPTGIEAGGRIWWNSLRPIHAALYFAFAWHAIQGHSFAWMILAADTLFGLIMFLLHHFHGVLVK